MPLCWLAPILQPALQRRNHGGVEVVESSRFERACGGVDGEVARDSITGRRRRVSRTVVGIREDAEVALARLKVADHERRLPAGGTS
jgi:hypothetical protein